MSTGSKDKRVKGLQGYLDTRSQLDEIKIDAFSVVLNSSIRARQKRCRRGGFKKFFDRVNDTYNNEDLHDQLLGLSFYYQDRSTNITIPGSFQGYSYPYFFPGVNDPAFVDILDFLGTFCGYAPDYFGLYDFPPFDGIGIQSYFIGYPYSIEFCEFPYTGPCCGDYPDYYAYSTMNLVDANYVYGQFIESYEYGDPQAVYSADRTYLYEYCGTYPYLHDTCNEHITFLHSFGSTDGLRTLVAGTKSRVYALNQSTGNWKIVADGLGSELRDDEDCDECPQEKWQGAVLENTIVLTNNYDPIIAYNPLSKPTSCNVWRATVIEDLVTLNITQAGAIGSWKGFVFLGDVYQDGARRRNRIAWCDFNDPYTWIPDEDNLAGFQDLGNDETVLRIESLNDYLFIYTDRAIFRAALIQSGGIVSFAFEEIYRGQEGALQYKFAFANAGNAHYYWAENRLVKFTSYDKEPKEPLVLRLCSNSVFDGVVSEDLNFGPLNEEACENFIGGFNPQFKEVWFSWPTDNSQTGGTDGVKHTCPSMSMVINVTPTEEGVDFFDSGFDAFHWFDGRRQSTLFEFFEDIQVCTREELLPELEKEGLPYDTVTSPAFDNPIQHIWNETEDTDLPASDSSLCSAFKEMWLRDICPKCDTLARFVMSSAVDKTLKEYADTAYYREFLEGGAYVLDGYDTVLESGVQDDDMDEEKDVIYFAVTGTSVPQTSPNLLYAYVRTGPTPDCMDWVQLKKYDDDCETLSEGLSLACLTKYSAAERESEGLRQDDIWDWPMEERGRYYGWKLKIDGTGGGSCFSRVNFKVSKIG